MARFNRIKHHSSTAKLVFLTSCAGLLGVALVVHFIWASSSFYVASFYSSVAPIWVLEKSGVVVVTDVTTTKIADKRENAKEKKEGTPERFLSATYADLPAPEFQWEEMPPVPVPRLDGAAIQIKNILYVFAGYGSLDYVHSHVDIYNFTSNTWVGRFDMPKEMGHSHLGVASDGRYIYVVSGQYGPQCRGPTARTFVLDTETKKWRSMPPLPAPRYAPASQLWRGRLHVMGGSKENRHTPGLEHWSIAVKDGKSLEKQWRTEIPIPRGGPHRACVVVNDRLFVIGGQEGDFMAKPGSPIFKCSRRHEVLYADGYMLDDEKKWKVLPPMPKPNSHIVFLVYADVYMLDDEKKWKVLPPMPKPNSHIECSWVIVNNSIIITGGTTEKHPVSKRMVLVGEVFQFHLDSLTWSVIGKLPFRIKTTLAGFWDGWLYFTSGQRDSGPDNPRPKKVIGEMWRTKLSL